MAKLNSGLELAYEVVPTTDQQILEIDNELQELYD